MRWVEMPMPKPNLRPRRARVMTEAMVLCGDHRQEFEGEGYAFKSRLRPIIILAAQSFEGRFLGFGEADCTFKPHAFVGAIALLHL